MKKFGLIIAVTLLSATALAEGTLSLPQPSIALATVEAGTVIDWKALNTKAENSSQTRVKWEKQSREMNEKLEGKIEQRLQEKLKRQLELAI